MIFKKTLLTLSLCAVSAFAAAAPAAATSPNLLQGVPAYVLSPYPWGFAAYTPLSDNDRVQRGGISWTGLASAPQQIYVVDFSGGLCMDKSGSCAAKPGKGAADANTVVIYSEQPVGAEIEASDTTLLGDKHHADFELYGYNGSELGVTLENTENKDWVLLGEVKGNSLVKRTISFPTAKYSKFQLKVRQLTYGPKFWSPTIVHMEALNLPVAPAQP